MPEGDISLVDTTILVDLLRNFTPAIEWLGANSEHQLYISDIAVLELYAGCRNSEERDEIDRFRRRFTSVPLSPDDTAWAVANFREFRLSHGIGILDVLIAAPAARLNIPLLTCNLKHFDFIPDIEVCRPYWGDASQ